MSRRILCILSLGGLLMASSSRVEAHGGAEASAFILDPAEAGITADTEFRFRWFDASDVGVATASTTHSFYHSGYLPPPWPAFAPPVGIEGTPILVDHPELDPINAHTWDSSGVASGVYWLWSQASDPDILVPSQTIVYSPFPVVVAHPGDPVHPFVTIESPDNPAAWAEDDVFELEYVGFDPDGSGQIRIERTLDGTEDFTLVAEGLTVTSTVVQTYALDTSSWEEGDWIFRATIEDGRGLSFSAYARYPMLVARLPDAGIVDAGLADAGAAGPGEDAGGSDGPPASDEGHSDGCRCAWAPRGNPSWVMLFALLCVACVTQRTLFRAKCD